MIATARDVRALRGPGVPVLCRREAVLALRHLVACGAVVATARPRPGGDGLLLLVGHRRGRHALLHLDDDGGLTERRYLGLMAPDWTPMLHARDNDRAGAQALVAWLAGTATP